MIKRYWAASANDIETNPCLVEGWVAVHLSSDYDALKAAVLDFLSVESTITSDEELSRYHATIAELRRLTTPETEVK